MQPLAGKRVVNLAVNVPGPVAAWRLGRLGAAVTKVVPPAGDPVEQFAPAWYAELTAGHHVVTLDLKDAAGRAALDGLLAAADLLLTSSRPSALARMGVGRDDHAARHPHLLQVAIVGHPEPDQERAGHDLTYAASAGLATPPELPRTILADLGGAERAVTAAVALLLAGEPRYVEVALSDAADYFALPLRHGLTAPGGVLGGGLPTYGLYRASDGWVAVAALEPHFARRLHDRLGDDLATAFAARTAAEWEDWAAEHDLPVVRVREP